MINYLLGFLLFFSIVNFIVLLALCSFIVGIADVTSQIKNFFISSPDSKEKKATKEDGGLIDV